MADELVPDDVREFILQYIDSITELEALLLLRANPDERWDLAGTTGRLYTDESEVEAVLSRLCAAGLLDCQEDVYRYAPQREEVRVLVDRVAAVYARHLIPVTNMIHAKERRIRDFADAFRFRRDR